MWYEILCVFRELFINTNIASIKQTRKNSSKKNDTYNYIKSKSATSRVIDYSKVKLYGLVGPLNFFGYGFLISLGSSNY